MEAERLRKKSIGFVPTMGALHDGHLSLVRAAKRENDVVAVSIFVNPAQFGPREDFARYPKRFRLDRKRLQDAKVDYLFYPGVRDMYPDGYQTRVSVGEPGVSGDLDKALCGRYRPGHFRGVVTVVLKLLHLAQPHRAYFGAKDYQQALLVGRLIRDLNLNIRLRVLPIVREKDGLAMSSRNQYLNERDRVRARALSRVLFRLRDQIRQGRRDILSLKQEAVRELKKDLDRIDYLDIVDPKTLESLRRIQPRMLAAAACYLGKTRLIDNVIIQS